MMVASGPLGDFVHRNPTVLMLALSFLLMIGMTLIADGFGFHIERGYIYAAMFFSSLVEALNEDFIRTARAKGVSQRSALWRHALPNALPPILTIMGLQFANLIAGAVVVENVFVLPGLGRLILQAIGNRDVLVVEDCVMGLATFVVALNLIIDLVVAMIDPRLRAGAA